MRKPAKRQLIKVGVATSDWSGSLNDPMGMPAMGGAGWVRFGQIKRHLRNHMVIGTLSFNGRFFSIHTHDRQSHADCAVIIIQRYMESWVIDAIESARNHGQIIVNDVDDWFWGLHPENQAYDLVSPQKNPNSNTEHYKEILLASNSVSCSTEFLAEKVSNFGCTTHMIRNGVSVENFPHRQHKSKNPLIGWTGSTAHRSGDLEIFADVAELLPGTTKFHHTGSYPKYPKFADKIGVDPKRVKTLPLLTPSEYSAGFPFDIGIVPLKSLDFNKAKSWIKGLEYVAANIPFIASPLPEYRLLHDEYGIGRLASDPKQWLAHLEELKDPKRRQEEALENRRKLLDFRLDSRSMAHKYDDFLWGLGEA